MTSSDPNGSDLGSVPNLGSNSDHIPTPTLLELPDEVFTINRELVRQLILCPICRLEIYCSPIYQCSSGHILCESCRQATDMTSSRCCICQGPMGPPRGIRNRALEGLLQVSDIVFPCPSEGCSKSIRFDDTLHLETCGYKKHPCPILASCKWAGRMCELPCHLVHKHNAVNKINGALLEFRENDILNHNTSIMLYGPYKGLKESVVVVLMAIPWENSTSGDHRLLFSQISIVIANCEKQPDVRKDFRMQSCFNSGILTNQKTSPISDSDVARDPSFKPLPLKDQFSVVSMLRDNVPTILQALRKNHDNKRSIFIERKSNRDGWLFLAADYTGCQTMVPYKMAIKPGIFLPLAFRFQFEPESMFHGEEGLLRPHPLPFGLTKDAEITEYKKHNKSREQKTDKDTPTIEASESIVPSRKPSTNAVYAFDSTGSIFVQPPIEKRDRVDTHERIPFKARVPRMRALFDGSDQDSDDGDDEDNIEI